MYTVLKYFNPLSITLTFYLTLSMCDPKVLSVGVNKAVVNEEGKRKKPRCIMHRYKLTMKNAIVTYV